MIKFENVTKTYPNGGKAVSNLNFHVKQGEFVCLIGPSGCGKTSTLKMINRLQESTSGNILVNGQNIKSQDPVQLRRGIGYVVQQIGLFPHMTIQENISVVPKLLGWPEEKRKLRCKELLQMVGLDPESYGNRYPAQLSGGQQQRVGVLRALAAEPDLVLMDEPFGALDPLIRESLQDELKRLQSKMSKTIVFVTHDMDEALKLADRIVLMKDGEIIQNGTPDDLLYRPASAFVEEFMGSQRLSVLDMTKVEKVMTAINGRQMPAMTPDITIKADTSVHQAFQHMFVTKEDQYWVVDIEGKPVGCLNVDSVAEFLKGNSAV
ncbi:ABC transporter ATP-binding protein [Paenibacillus solisilvae]|uniref:Quaternary amine transport ATP-binding protein n=1 Tax=Paenibacillus solisilvae TaxID=2486751 RepID=A0ABW0VVK2_9BACL